MAKSPPRPVPVDFIEVCDHLGNGYAVRRHYKCGQTTFERWQRESGRSFLRKLPIPADFAKVASQTGISGMSKHYAVSVRVIKRWLRDSDIEPIRTIPHRRPTGAKRTKPLRAVPSDFEKIAPTKYLSELVELYAAGHRTVRRWLKETNMRTRQIDRSMAAKAAIRRAGRAPQMRRMFKDDIRNIDIYDIAADKLRRTHPTHRCNERGGYDPNGEFWRVGRNVVTPDELIEKANRLRMAS